MGYLIELIGMGGTLDTAVCREQTQIAAIIAKWPLDAGDTIKISDYEYSDGRNPEDLGVK